jgi:hypothetical protein
MIESLESRLDAKLIDLYEKLDKYNKTIKFIFYKKNMIDIKIQIKVLEELKGIK